MEVFLKWFTFALQLLPGILQAITSVEETVGSGNGPAKKALVMGAVQAILPVQCTSPPADGVVSSLIDSSVAGLNKAGKLLPHKVG